MDKFRQKFIEEAVDLINDLEEALLLIDQDMENTDLIERIFRAMHSLKGGGAMFGFDMVSEFTHHLESIYDDVRNSKLKLNKDILTATLESVDYIKELIFADDAALERLKQKHAVQLEKVSKLVTPSGTEFEHDAAVAIPQNNTKSTFYLYFKPDIHIFQNGTNPLFLLDELTEVGETEVIAFHDQIPSISALNPGSSYMYWEVLINTSEGAEAISDVFLFVEDDAELEVKEISFVDFTQKSVTEYLNECRTEGKRIELSRLYQSNSENREQAGSAEKATAVNSLESNISSIRVTSEKIDILMNLVSELVTTQARLSLFAEKDENPELAAIAENIQKLSRQLRDNAFSISLIQIQSVVTRFQRLVRDLSLELGKKIRFTTKGTETELDKTIVENLTDPIMHILRNSVDHGIESPVERKKSGKKEEGTILLESYYSGTNVYIKIRDDGRGINHEKVRASAIRKGLITEDAFLTKKEMLELIFLPGFSTAESVTDVSGRGVGMDVVKRKITAIRGEVNIESETGVGTTLTIKLPLTLSIIDGLLVKIGSTDYIIPLSVVDKIYAVSHEDLLNKYTSQLILDGEQIPFHYLREYFEMRGEAPLSEQAIIVTYEEKRIAVIVDYVVGEYQAVIKPLGRQYKDQDFISGATILGDGSVALVLDTNKIIQNSSRENKKEN